ncbi:MAG: arginyl-tRNA synthetase [Rhodospirillaceae bacterium]|nr:MAG: arginyl-tRNA synthetase [Rhodospirillaceae bacterium]
MNVFTHFQTMLRVVVSELATSGKIPSDQDGSKITCEPPREAGHGDVATNAAMVLAKSAGMKPHALAAMIAARLEAFPEVTEVTVAGPGFINMRLADDFWRERLREILETGPAYGDSTLGQGRRVNVEFVSANPTGPLHVGHGRGAVVGDALAALLEKTGHAVTREYYINDAGAQVDVLARSTYLRYREALGETIGPIPEGYYPGTYLFPVGQALARREGRRWLSAPESEWLEPVRTFAIEALMAVIGEDLAALGVRHDVFSSEHALVTAGGVENAVGLLAERGLVYEGVLDPPKGKQVDNWEPRPQLLFRATRFGDDIDRPLRKSDGRWTYFASDLAYHLDKYHRGFSSMIDVWGADHGGYVRRVQAAVQALTEGKGTLDVKLCQMVALLDAGEPVKMSKRAGTFVTLREVIDQVGRDVVRFIMLTRKNDAHLDFDFARVTEQSRDNPVFYVQYAHARACSVHRHATEIFPGVDLSPRGLSAYGVHRLTDPSELGLIRMLAGWPRVVEGAALAHEPHRVAYYLYDLAGAFHGLWHKGNERAELRFLVPDDPELSFARLALVQGMATVVASGLAVFGVDPVEEMR